MRSSLILLLALVTTGCVAQSKYQKLQDMQLTTQAALDLEKERSATLQGELDGLKLRADALEENLRKVQAARDEAIRQLEADLAGAKQAGGARAAELEKTLAAAREERDAQLASLQKELDAAKAEAAAKAAELDKLNATYGDLVKGLQNEIDQGRVTITNLKGRLTVNLIDQILFDSGSAELKPEGKKVLDKVSDVLARVNDRRISVEGHTDNVPISKSAQARFPTNWELSTARAGTVVRYLQERGVPPERLSATGFSMYRPVAANDSEENRHQNRRIEIVLLPELKEGK
jgi:chemotaxis protein MotB